MVERVKITLKGVVQGVGFRPYVYTLAESLQLRGYVTNTSDGVTIDVEGRHITEFVERLSKTAPPLSRITDLSITPLPEYGYADFRIIESREGGSPYPFTLISPDISICDDCLRELMDPSDRRFLYPFVNCTNCGPRYTIIRAVPYDRPHTTMDHFSMCPQCDAEYHNPGDRRFHAQPNACPECGPRVTLVSGSQGTLNGQAAVEKTISLLRAGKIVAVKGLGGFHIACDATNRDAVERLRERKRRSNKPFALMATDRVTVERFCVVTEEEANLLSSLRRPIVLLRKKEDISSLPDAVSPHNRYLGFMLPYTPLHYLLFHQPFADGRGGIHNGNEPNFSVLVMTSGNLSEEPIVRDNDEAYEKLGNTVDAFLFHNRDIFMRVDDSVVRVGYQQSAVNAQENRLPTEKNKRSVLFIRRSRGYAPEPLPLQSAGPEVLGCGADIKNAFTVTKGEFAIPSQHIGDMENYETVQFFEECLENIRSVFRVNPVAIGHDLHPGYLSTQWALRQGVRTYGIQHHYAHIGSVMAEKGLVGKILGVAFDGTGYGTDGNLWGGEILLADIYGFERLAHFKHIPLPGGERAVREPWRTAVSYVLDAAGDETMEYLVKIGFIEKYGKDRIEKMIRIAQSRELSPRSSGAGRLFDAVSALAGVCDANTFEGEAAMTLESLATEETEADYPVNIILDTSMVIDFSHTIIGIVNDVVNGVEKRLISTKFHNTVSNVILRTVARLREVLMLEEVALTGGTFQNLYLLERTARMLTAAGMKVFINEMVPCNDACISLGQAYLIRERMKYSGLK
ncbi:MAG TPA: carbamoyltransferase HypF, partial [Thermodesulfovibrionales bacterium]|nr:carbamoyltransferase HypF [Thermodesulfovibrionales bacterium]